MAQAPSLTRRLLVGSCCFTALALMSMLVLMHGVLHRFVTGQIDQRLDDKIVSLLSQVRVGADGTVRIEGDANGPPFDRRHHHAFWIVQGPRNTLHTEWPAKRGPSVPPNGEAPGQPPGLDAVAVASLANAAPSVEPPPPPPSPPLDSNEREPPPRRHPATVEARDSSGTLVHERVLRTQLAGTPLLVVVAAPVAAISGPVREAMITVGLATAALGGVLVAAALVQVILGLRPLRALSGQVARVRGGELQQLPLPQPLEILPLVGEINALLAENALNLERARRHVANLAHGLKTPMTTLALTLGRVDEPERTEAAALVEDLDRRVRHHLGRARAAALGGPVRTRTPLAARLDDLCGALRRIYAERAIEITLSCPETLALACEPHDVDEIFGNLLDNACKFAQTRAACEVSREGRDLVARITDDGPGLSSSQRALALQPGQRLDETTPGFGFGLTIVRELVELYAGSLDLGGDGAMVVTVRLPAALDLDLKGNASTA